MHEISSHKFENDVRRNLRFGHGLEHHDLEKMSGLFHAGLERAGKKSFKVKDEKEYGKMMEHMRDHAKEHNIHMSDRDWAKFDTALKGHLGLGGSANDNEPHVHDRAA